MRVKVLVVFCCHIALSKELTRRSPGSDGLGSTFATFQGPSFFKIRDQEFSAYNSNGAKNAAPAPAPVYNSPAPAPPQYKPKPKGPTHDCSIQYDKKTAQICLPKLGRPQCSQVAVKGVGTTTAEKCLQITRTVCTQSEEEMTVESCTIKYTPTPMEAEASLVDVTYEKECTTMMVTVCQPPGYGYHDQYDPYAKKCKEIAQETCYNRPSTVPRPTSVTVMVPSPSQECGPMTVKIPTVQCEDITEEKCVQLPSLEPVDVPAEKCTVGVEGQDCQEMELQLPLQVCREQLYGDAHKVQKSSGYHQA